MHKPQLLISTSALVKALILFFAFAFTAPKPLFLFLPSSPCLSALTSSVKYVVVN